MIPERQDGAGGYREHDILVVTEQGTEDITRTVSIVSRNGVRRQR